MRAFAAALLLAACTARDPIATGPDDVAAYCETSSPPVLADGTCTGDLASTLFRRAVCGCDALSIGDLATDGFDARIAPYAPGGLGGDVACDLGLDAAAIMTIGGDLMVAGAEGFEGGATVDVLGDLASGGLLGRSSSAITVGGAARIAGDVDVASLDVAGTLTTAPGTTSSGVVTAGATATADVTVPPTCRCDDLDVAAVVAQHAAANHNAAIELAPDAFASVEGDATLDLPCGLFYLDQLQGSGTGTITIRATGRAALFIAGNITLGQTLQVDLADGAELDLFVAGYIQTAALHLGDPARPSALRVYVASDGNIEVTTGSSLAAHLYAPRSDLSIAAPLEIYGSIVVRHLLGAALDVHHDLAIDDAGSGC
jgi:hypothetical protein